MIALPLNVSTSDSTSYYKFAVFVVSNTGSFSFAVCNASGYDM